MRTFTNTETYVVESCYKCGVKFAMTERHREALKRDGEAFYCLNGHRQSYCNTTRADLDEARNEAARLRDRVHYYQNTTHAAERRVSAQRGVVTRIKNRIAKGACPCCSRTFKNLGRHMKSKHPNYAEDD